MDSIPDHIKKDLTRLRRDKTPNSWDKRTRKGAPHKPFLLLSVADGIEQGWITGSQIKLRQELIETFRLYWNGAMGEEHVTTIALPFFHMQNERFWELHYAQGEQPFRTSPSLGALRRRILHAEMDPTLYEVMADPAGRHETRKLLLNNYFTQAVACKIVDLRDFNYKTYRYARQLDELVAEPFHADHCSEEKGFYRTVTQLVRDAGFSYRVRSAYNYTCAVCRSRLITHEGATLVDGAHILPFHKYKNDDPRNGLSLCKNHHWMFDYHIIRVDKEYRIRVLIQVVEDSNQVEETMKWDGEMLLLPDDERLWPAVEVLG